MWPSFRSIAVGIAATALALATGGTSSAGTPPRPTCTFDPVTHTLTVEYANDGEHDELKLVRGGDEVVVLERSWPDRLAFSPVGCTGETPTVLNVDRIDILVSGGYPIFYLDLGEGPFAPGFTEEGDSSSEIEIFYPRIPDTEGWGGFTRIDGASTSDHVRVGTTGDALAANLNADEPAPDVDLFVERGSVFQLHSHGGADRISADGGPEFDGPAGAGDRRDSFHPVLIWGGDGGDRLVGTPAVNSSYGSRLDGQDGGDVLIGKQDDDDINGGLGRDVLEGKGGDDDLTAVKKPSEPDRVRCGGGTDFARVDKEDVANDACERIKVYRHDGLP